MPKKRKTTNKSPSEKQKDAWRRGLFERYGVLASRVLNQNQSAYCAVAATVGLLESEGVVLAETKDRKNAWFAIAKNLRASLANRGIDATEYMNGFRMYDVVEFMNERFRDELTPYRLSYMHMYPSTFPRNPMKPGLSASTFQIVIANMLALGIPFVTSIETEYVKHDDHAVLVLSSCDDDQTVLILNSWGENHAKAGYEVMPRDELFRTCTDVIFLWNDDDGDVLYVLSNPNLVNRQGDDDDEKTPLPNRGGVCAYRRRQSREKTPYEVAYAPTSAPRDKKKKTNSKRFNPVSNTAPRRMLLRSASKMKK